MTQIEVQRSSAWITSASLLVGCAGTVSSASTEKSLWGIQRCLGGQTVRHAIYVEA